MRTAIEVERGAGAKDPVPDIDGKGTIHFHEHT